MLQVWKSPKKLRLVFSDEIWLITSWELYRIILCMDKGTMKWLQHRIGIKQHYPRDIAPLRTTIITLFFVQWNLVNTVTNGPKKIGRINEVAVLPGRLKSSSWLKGRKDKYSVHCIHRTVLINKQPECSYSRTSRYGHLSISDSFRCADENSHIFS